MEALRRLLAALDREGDPAPADDIAFRIEALDRIDACLPHADEALRRQAMAASDRLESRNARFFESLREDIRSGLGPERLMACLARWERPRAHADDPQAYDLLDELVAGLLRIDEPAVPTVELSPDMVFYQPTPARHILAMIRHSRLGPDDVLVDLGSGLGHVPLLAAICTRATAIGIELEPAYVACAQAAAGALALSNVRFMQADARAADVSAGTVFYLYTPFKGAILRDVLERLRDEATRRPIRVCTFGPCTAEVTQQSWLIRSAEYEANAPAIFHSG